MDGRRRGRVLLVSVLAVASLAIAGPARAHVSVSADRPEAGAAGVTLTFSAESESGSAGISSLRVVLPAGIRPDQVSWVSGPAGWALTPGPDGYTVGGPPLPVGADATYVVRIAQLPAGAASLPFKTLQGYADGRVDRWIEVPVAGQPEPENPAPVLLLRPAQTPAAITVAPVPATPGTSAPAAAPASSGGSSRWSLVGAVVALLALGATVLVWWHRRAAARR